MKLQLTDVMMSTNGQCFGFQKPDGSSFFEFETSEASKQLRKQIKVLPFTTSQSTGASALPANL